MRGDSIVLIGFMGAGKTAVGKELAVRADMEFVDTDSLVESHAGRSVSEIFASEGEAGFRAREKAAVAEAASAGGRVIASGGGAVLALVNYRELQKAGAIVYLRATPDALRERIGMTSGRPMLSHPHAFDRLLVERVPAYEAAADLIVDTDGRAPDEVAVEILRRLER